MPHLPSYLLIGLIGLAAMAFEPMMAAGTSDNTAESEPAANYTNAKTAIEAEDYASALPLLTQLVQDQPENADAWNLFGFANRKLGNLDAAAAAYQTALKINPGHLGALEYQGEMYVEMGKLDMATTNLATLTDLCGACEQATDLQAAIDKGKS